MDTSFIKIQKVSLYGAYADETYYKILETFKFLKSINKNFQAESKQFFKFDFHLFLQELKNQKKFKDTDIAFRKTKEGPIIIVNDKIYLNKSETYFNLLFSQYEYVDAFTKENYKTTADLNFSSYLKTFSADKFVQITLKIDHPDYPNDMMMIFKIFPEILPRTCENFLTLLKGGYKVKEGESLGYKDTKIHRVYPNGYIQGGDVDMLNGLGGQSIFGPEFEDENYILKHNKPGIIGMAPKNGRKNSNNSQFYITLCRMDDFDKKNVAFGRLINGFKALKTINLLPLKNGNLEHEVTIVSCGRYSFNL